MPPRAIVIALDQLSRRCLGCYGHEWIETPNFDQLAARGVVFDQCFASPVDEAPLQHATFGWIEQLQRDGVDVRWLREPDESNIEDTDDLSQTSISQLMTLAEQTLIELQRGPESSWLLWLDSRGIGWPGIAISQFVELYADELDDVPTNLMASREIEVTYAALLTQFDHLLGRLLKTIERLFGDAPPLLIVMAAHGQSVGEADMLAPFVKQTSESSADASSFRDELVHAPLLIVGATGGTLGSRRSELVMPADVEPTLCEWFGISPIIQHVQNKRSLLPLLRNTGGVPRSELFLRDDEGSAAIRTEEFFFIQPNADRQSDQGESPSWLFLKPEDSWEVNDVAAQYPEQVARLRSVLSAWRNVEISQPQTD